MSQYGKRGEVRKRRIEKWSVSVDGITPSLKLGEDGPDVYDSFGQAKYSAIEHLKSTISDCRQQIAELKRTKRA